MLRAELGIESINIFSSEFFKFRINAVELIREQEGVKKKRVLENKVGKKNRVAFSGVRVAIARDVVRAQELEAESVLRRNPDQRILRDLVARAIISLEFGEGDESVRLLFRVFSDRGEDLLGRRDFFTEGFEHDHLAFKGHGVEGVELSRLPWGTKVHNGGQRSRLGGNSRGKFLRGSAERLRGRRRRDRLEIVVVLHHARRRRRGKRMT